MFWKNLLLPSGNVTSQETSAPSFSSLLFAFHSHQFADLAGQTPNANEIYAANAAFRATTQVVPALLLALGRVRVLYDSIWLFRSCCKSFFSLQRVACLLSGVASLHSRIFAAIFAAVGDPWQLGTHTRVLGYGVRRGSVGEPRRSRVARIAFLVRHLGVFGSLSLLRRPLGSGTVAKALLMP